MKRFGTILIWASAVLAVCFVAAAFNSFLGNPISKQLANQGAKKHMATHYPALVYQSGDAFYNFKTGGYSVSITVPDSIDTHFSIMLSMNGTVLYDSFDSVSSGWNTAQRIDDRYREMVEAVFSAPEFPLVSEIDFGLIEFIKDDWPAGPDQPDYAIKMKSLVLDQEYSTDDLKAFAQTAGHIIYYAQDEEVSFSRAAQCLLQIKEALDQADVPFYAIDFVLEKPRSPDGTINPDQTAIHTKYFLARDIHPEGLAERVEANHNALTAYYAEQDAVKNRQMPVGA